MHVLCYQLQSAETGSSAATGVLVTQMGLVTSSLLLTTSPPEIEPQLPSAAGRWPCRWPFCWYKQGKELLFPGPASERRALQSMPARTL